METFNKKLAAVLEQATELYREQGGEKTTAFLWKSLLKREDFAHGWALLADLEMELGHFEKAVDAVAETRALIPDDPKTLFKLASILRDAGRNDLAVEVLTDVLSFLPKSAAVWSNLGNAKADLGRFSEAEDDYRKALEIDSGFVDALNNWGLTCIAQGWLSEAEQHFQNALALDGLNCAALLNLGGLALQSGELDAALGFFDRTLAIDPENGAGLYNKACVLGQLGRFEDAIATLKAVVKKYPDDQDSQAQLFHLLQKTCAWDDMVSAEKRLEAMTVESLNQHCRPGETPFMSIARSADPERNFKVAKAWSKEMQDRLAPLRANCSFSGASNHQGPLRLGYLSGNFYDHPTAYNTAGLFAAHDRSRFKVFAYSFGPDDQSECRRQIERAVDCFVDLSGMGDVDAAKRIHQDGIDILIALTGHTDGSRLEICALKPAPIQVGYLTFPGTCGGDFLDYVLVDKVVCPSADSEFFSEAPAYLPGTYWPTNDQQKIALAPPSRASQGLTEKSFVFACFSQTYKIDPKIFSVWMSLLNSCPESCLWLFGSNQIAVENLKTAAKELGVDPQRLVFANKLPKPEHLVRLSLADLMLDTRIYGGHTTTVDALWAGVPVIALRGSHFASRVSASLLMAHGLDDLVAPDLERYRALALELAQTPDKLKSVTDRVKENQKTQPLFDTKGKVRDLENLFERMWTRHLDGISPGPLLEEGG